MFFSICIRISFFRTSGWLRGAEPLPKINTRSSLTKKPPPLFVTSQTLVKHQTYQIFKVGIIFIDRITRQSGKINFFGKSIGISMTQEKIILFRKKRMKQTVQLRIETPGWGDYFMNRYILIYWTKNFHLNVPLVTVH